MVGPNVPMLALRLAVIVSFDVALAVTGLGPKLALTPFGSPLTLRFTELEPFTAVTVTVVEPFDPRLTVSELGEAERLKSGVPPPPPLATVNEAMTVLQLKLKNRLFLL